MTMMSVTREEGKARKAGWSEDEDRLLISMVEKYSNGGLSWKLISSHIPRRSPKQCRERWRFNLDPSICRKPFSVDEDAVIVEEQIRRGNEWSMIAKKLPGRTENAIKIRFKSIARGSVRCWTSEDDQALLLAHSVFGSDWEKIAASLPNRTKNSVKMRLICLRKPHGNQIKSLKEGSAEQLFHSDEYKDLARRFIEQNRGVKKGLKRPRKEEVSYPPSHLKETASVPLERGTKRPNLSSKAVFNAADLNTARTLATLSPKPIFFQHQNQHILQLLLLQEAVSLRKSSSSYPQ